MSDSGEDVLAGKNFIPVITKKFSRIIRYEEVMIIEIVERCVCLVTLTETIRTQHRMKDMINAVSGRRMFCVCHSGLIINMNSVTHMENGYIRFSNDDVRYLGAHSFARTRQIYNEYISE